MGLMGACGSLPPLRGHIEVGSDPFVIFVGGTSRAGGDLYAVPGAGGSAVPVTFTAVGEMRPALAPNGGAVAFLRGATLRDSTPGTVWVMNLLSGAERQIALPRGAPVSASTQRSRGSAQGTTRAKTGRPSSTASADSARTSSAAGTGAAVSPAGGTGLRYSWSPAWITSSVPA